MTAKNVIHNNCFTDMAHTLFKYAFAIHIWNVEGKPENNTKHRISQNKKRKKKNNRTTPTAP